MREPPTISVDEEFIIQTEKKIEEIREQPLVMIKQILLANIVEQNLPLIIRELRNMWKICPDYFEVKANEPG